MSAVVHGLNAHNFESNSSTTSNSKVYYLMICWYGESNDALGKPKYLWWHIRNVSWVIYCGMGLSGCRNPTQLQHGNKIIGIWAQPMIWADKRIIFNLGTKLARWNQMSLQYDINCEYVLLLLDRKRSVISLNKSLVFRSITVIWSLITSRFIPNKYCAAGHWLNIAQLTAAESKVRDRQLIS